MEILFFWPFLGRFPFFKKVLQLLQLFLSIIANLLIIRTLTNYRYCNYFAILLQLNCTPFFLKLQSIAVDCTSTAIFNCSKYSSQLYHSTTFTKYLKNNCSNCSGFLEIPQCFFV